MLISQFNSVAAPSSADARFTEQTAVVGGSGHVDANELLGKFTTSFSQLDSQPDDFALVVSTSGSTGAPKRTALTTAVLAASARATEAFTSTDNAQWLLALPLHYVAGAQVVARSALAGTTPVLTKSISSGGPFSAQDFVSSASALTAHHRMTSLVPTQLHKLLETAERNPQMSSEILDALRSFDALLLGGAPASAALLEQMLHLKVPVLTTYGSAETAGGCVYSGAALPGVQVQIEPETEEDAASGSGRIWLGGPTLASGYLDDPQRTAAHFFTGPDGTRWYKTDDRGTFTGSLTVLGRADDTIITGGLKISAGVLARLLETHSSVREALVVGLPDARWGQALVAALTLRHSHPGAENPEPLDPQGPLATQLSDLVTQHLGKAAVPKLTLVYTDFPTLSTGKPDRTTVTSHLEQYHRQQ